MRRIHDLLVSIWEGKESGFRVQFVKPFLLSLSAIYSFLVRCRFFLYNNAILPRKKLPCLVISVGNVTVGGTGKTPLVELLAHTLQGLGNRVAIINRGYGGKYHRMEERRGEKKEKVRIISDGKRVYSSAVEAGDESYLLARNLPGVAVISGKDRYHCGLHAIRNLGVDTIILDDGFQNYSLERDYDLVTVDSSSPWGNGYLLPRGPLREPWGNLIRADVIILTRVDQIEDSHVVRKQLVLNSGVVPVVESVHQPLFLEEMGVGKRYGLDFLSGKSVFLLCSIGRPEAFRKTLTGVGAVIKGQACFPDHYSYSRRDALNVQQEAVKKGTDCIITTTKDAVRLPLSEIDCLVPVFSLRVEMKIVGGTEKLLQYVLPGMGFDCLRKG